MRPNLVASGWNFAHFQSKLHGGVSAIQMEFTTCTTHGRKGTGSGGVVVNVGSVVVAGKLASVVAETKWAGEEYTEDAPAKSRALFLNTVRDPETGYKWPTEIEFRWAGPSVVADAPGQVDAKVLAELGNLEDPKGLIVKVDILAEIPYVIKMAVNYVAGTKPYMYQVSRFPVSCTKIDAHPRLAIVQEPWYASSYRTRRSYSRIIARSRRTGHHLQRSHLYLSLVPSLICNTANNSRINPYQRHVCSDISTFDQKSTVRIYPEFYS